jgi:hypothetical protein
MACLDCTPSTPVAAFVFSGTSPCTTCDDSECPKGTLPTSCIYNSGPALLCIGSDENERLDSILNKIDAKLCSLGAIDPYPDYNTYCLGSMADQQQFVETISQRYCNLLSAYNTFTGTTYPAAITTINNTITALNTPNLTTCNTIGYASGDTLKIAMQKLTNYVCGVTGSLDLSGVTWDLCTTVTTPPTTVQEGFDFVIQQICNVNTDIAGLPTFNNIGSCLDSPGASDSLQSTIIKIRSKLCTAPSFNPGTYTGGCFTVSGATTLDTLLQSLLTQVTSVMQSIPRVFNPAQFTVSNVDVSNACLGKQISLNGTTSDRFVALNTADMSPSTLDNKFVPGAGVTLDFGILNPGKVTISATGTDNYTVKTDSFDTTPGFLNAKIIGSSGIVSINPVVSGGQMQINAFIDDENMADAILSAIDGNPTLLAKLCALISQCPSPCAAPQNVQVTYVP